MKILVYLLFSIIFCMDIYSQTKANNQLVSVSVLDENGLPAPSRVRFTGPDSVYYAPEGHKTDFTIIKWLSEGGDVMLDYGKRFAYVNGQFQIYLPPGDIRIEVIKGFVYRIFIDTVNITSQTSKLNIQLEKWFHFEDNNWYSGDVHVHAVSPETALMEMKAEDLNVCEILTTDVTDDQYRFLGKQDPLSDENHIVYVNQEYREDRLGHLIFLNLKELVEPVKPMRSYQYPLNLAGCDEAHKQGGFTLCAHFSQNQGFEWPLGIVMNKIDALELMSCILPFKSATSGMWNLIPDHQGNNGLRLWYRLLNCGFKVPVVAGTDKASNMVTMGANRIYTYVDKPFTYEKWISSLRSGRGFITNSPFLFLDINGKLPGDKIYLNKGDSLNITADVWCQFPLDYLEIIANGNVIAEKHISSGPEHSSLSVTYKPDASCWISARAYESPLKHEKGGTSFSQNRFNGGGPTKYNSYYGTEAPELPFAHTNPLYIEVDKKQVYSKSDAEYYSHFLENAIYYLQTEGKFPSEEAKQSVILQFEEGRQKFLNLKRE